MSQVDAKQLRLVSAAEQTLPERIKIGIAVGLSWSLSWMSITYLGDSIWPGKRSCAGTLSEIVYKSANVTCGILLTLICFLFVFRVEFFVPLVSVGESRRAPRSWFVVSRANAAGTRHVSDIVVERMYEH